MENKIKLNYNNLGVPESWFYYPDSLNDMEFDTAIKIFEKDIGNGFKFNNKMYSLFNNVKMFHVYFFPIFQRNSPQQIKIKILSAMIILWLFILDDYYEETITKDNCNLMCDINLKIMNALIKPDSELDDKLSNNEIITKVVKNFASDIIKDDYSILYNNFISSINQFISSSIAYYSLNEPTYSTIAELRVGNSGVPIVEATYLINYFNLLKEDGSYNGQSNNDLIFINDPRYTRLKWIQSLIICIHNDLFSSDNEKEKEQHVNSFWIEYKINHGDLNLTYDSLINRVNGYVNEFLLLEQSLTKSYPNNNCILHMIKSLKYSISGNILTSINTNRYINNNSSSTFIKGNEIDAIHLKNK